MKKTFVFLFCLANFALLFAQDDVSTKEAGTYQRKSVAFLNVLVNKGGSWNSQWSVSNHEMVDVLQNSVRFERFDYNNVPKNIVDKFIAMPSSIKIEERMNQTVVPAILAAVDANKEVRAMNLLSEQQKNSFITDKAKELGITADELNAVMNSAYIFAPVYLGYSDSSYSIGSGVTAYKLTLSAGGYWWKIDNSGEKPAAKLIAHIERTYSSIKYSNERYIHDGQIIGYKEAAFRGALNAIAVDVQTATKGVPEFQLSAQILDKNPRNVVISIGTREGVNTDDKFWVYQSYEDENGKVTNKKRGWVMVKKVGEKAHGLDSAQSKAQIISGIPYIGSTVKEIPQLPIDITAGFVMSPVSIDTSSRGAVRIDELSNMYGLKLKTNMNLFRRAGGSQWWLGVGGELLFGHAEGEFGDSSYEIDYPMAVGIDISFMKKIFVRRFVLAPEIGLGFKNIMIFGDENSLSNFSSYKRGRISQWQIGLLGNMGFEFAITPTFHLGGSAGWDAFTRNNMWKFSRKGNRDTSWVDDGFLRSINDLKTSGPTWSVYVSFAVPHSSKSNSDLVVQKDGSVKDGVVTNPQEEASGQTPENDKYKSENDAKETAPKKKQSGAGEFFKAIFSL